MEDVLPGLDGRPKCRWCVGDPLYEAYHDLEWGTPLHDDRRLFALLMLEGFQAGLSWRTVLHKRENFERAFRGWDPEAMAGWGPVEVERLLGDPGIIRNRLKVEGAIRNARAWLAVVEEFGSFDRYLWQVTGGEPLRRQRQPVSFTEVPVTTPESDALSKDLRKRGFTFVGSTIIYAYMQSAGLVDDHLEGCWRADWA